MKELNYIIDTQAMIKDLELDSTLLPLGTSDRFNDRYQESLALFNVDNTHNHEFVAEYNGKKGFFTLDQHMEIRTLYLENLDKYLIALSFHTGTDIRSGYTDELLYISEVELIGEILCIIESHLDCGIMYKFIKIDNQ